MQLSKDKFDAVILFLGKMLDWEGSSPKACWTLSRWDKNTDNIPAVISISLNNLSSIT